MVGGERGVGGAQGRGSPLMSLLMVLPTTNVPCVGQVTTSSHVILVQVEGRNVGRVSTEIYRIYARAWGAFYVLPLLMVGLAVGERSFYGLQNWWLSVWSNANAAQVVASDTCC